MAANKEESVQKNVCRGDIFLITASAVVSALILFVIAFGYFYLGDLSLAEENSITENLQAVYCMLASLAFGYAAYKKPMKAEFRFFVIFFSALSFAFILRELDIERFDVPQWLILIGSGIGRNLLYVAVFLPMLIRFVLNFRSYFSHGLIMLRTSTGMCVAAAALLLGFSDIAERISFDTHVMVEELFELMGYMMLMMGGLLSARLAGQVANITGPDHSIEEL